MTKSFTFEDLQNGRILRASPLSPFTRQSVLELVLSMRAVIDGMNTTYDIWNYSPIERFDQIEFASKSHGWCLDIGTVTYPYFSNFTFESKSPSEIETQLDDILSGRNGILEDAAQSKNASWVSGAIQVISAQIMKFAEGNRKTLNSKRSKAERVRLKALDFNEISLPV
ncbi:hypothetical protein Aperf_G00000095375 [Anoplocephala perfoliata]